MRCYPTNELLRFLEEGFAADEAAAFESHLRTCAVCHATLAQLAQDEPPESCLPELPTRTPPARGAQDQAGVTDADRQYLLELTPALQQRLLEEVEQSAPAGLRQSFAKVLPAASARDAERGAPAVAADGPEPALPQIPGLEVVRLLGQGGMGIVFEAFDPQLRRRVAVKMIGRHRASAEGLGRIRQEAEAVARLNHPQIVQIYGVGDIDGQAYVVLEYVGGGTLADRLEGRPQPPREAAALAAKLARAIHLAHQQQVIHRDLKPRNVLLEGAGLPDGGLSAANLPLSAVTPKITDFGLAKLLDSDVQWTRSDQIVGTPAYAAPEQLKQTLAAVGPATDVYALGAILYELLTGRPPLQADDTWRTMQLVLETEPLAPRLLQPGVPGDLETICLHCLAKEPSRRYTTAVALAEDLERFLAHEPIRARPQGWLGRTRRWARRNPALATLTSALALLLVSVAIGATVIAEHFRGAEAEQRQLSQQKSALADRNQQLANEREDQRQTVAAALLQSRQSLADSYRALGLREETRGRPDLAAVCFAEAAALTPGDEPRRLADESRARNALRVCPCPVAYLPDASGDLPDEMAFHPSGRWLICNPADGRAAAPTLWDIDAQVPLTWPAEFGTVTALAWASAGQQLAVGTNDGRVLLATFPDLQPVSQTSLAGRVQRVALSADGRCLAAATAERLQLWTADTPTSSPTAAAPTQPAASPTAPATAWTPVGPAQESAAAYLDLQFSPDSQWYLTVTADQTLLLRSTTGKPTEPALRARCGVGSHEGARLPPQFDSLGRLIWWSDRIVSWFELAKQQIVRQEPTGLASFCEVSPRDGDVLVGKERVYQYFAAKADSVANAMPRPTSEGPGGSDAPAGTNASRAALQWLWPWLRETGVNRLRLSDDQRRLATISDRRQLRVWTLPQPLADAVRIPGSQPWDRGSVSPDGQFVLARRSHLEAQVHRLADGVAAGPRLVPDGELVEAAWTGTAATVLTLAARGNETLLDVWDGLTGARTTACRTIPVPPGDPASSPHDVLAISADGQTAAFVTADGQRTVLVPLDAAGSEPRLLDLPAQWLLNLPQAERLLLMLGPTHGQTDEVAVFEWRDGGVSQRVPMPNLAAACATRDGGRVALGDRQARVRLFDPRTGTLTPLPQANGAWPVGFSQDGQRLLTRGQDRSFRLWDLETRKLAAPMFTQVLDATATLAAGDRALVTCSQVGTCQMLSTHDAQPLRREIRLPLEPALPENGGFSFSLTDDGRYAVVGGKPWIMVLNVAANLPRSPVDARTLAAWCRLVSGHRLESGQPTPLAWDEWNAEWQAFSAAHRRALTE